MQTITGLFDTYEHATAAVHALKEAGVTQTDISLVAHTTDEFDADKVGDGATAGAEIGAGLGAAGGLLAGLGIVAIPGVGPIVAAGWLFATAIGALAGAGVGAATGGLVGSFTSAGVPQPDAEIMAETVHRGGAVVSARVDVAHVVAAVAIIRNAAGVELSDRRVSPVAEPQGEIDTPAIGLAADPRVQDPPGRFPLVPPYV